MAKAKTKTVRKTQLQKLLDDAGACDNSRRWAKRRGAVGAWTACREPGWLIWICNRLGIDYNVAVVEADKRFNSSSQPMKWCNEFRKHVKRPTMAMAREALK